MLVLYDYPLAYNPAKARLMLAEKGLEYKTNYVNLFNGQSLEPAFMSINPASTVPVLVDGATTLTQSLAIVRHLDTLGPTPLGGTTGVDRTFVDSFSTQIDAWDGNLFLAANSDARARGVLQSLSKFRINYCRARAAQHPTLRFVYEAKIAAIEAADAEVDNPTLVHENDARLKALLDSAEGRLGGDTGVAGDTGVTGDTGVKGSTGTQCGWLAGQHYTQADVLFTVVLFRIMMAKLEDKLIAPRPVLQGYLKRVQARPSWASALAPALSGSTSAKWLLPAVLKATWCNFIKRY